MLEKEACEDQPSPREEVTDVKMVDQEDCGDPEPSGPPVEAETEDNPQLVSGENTVSPEEEEILLHDIPQLEDHSPGSETTLVSGGMAELCLASPAHPGLEEGETPQ